jgi:hypothetical protein
MIYAYRFRGFHMIISAGSAGGLQLLQRRAEIQLLLRPEEGFAAKMMPKMVPCLFGTFISHYQPLHRIFVAWQLE